MATGDVKISFNYPAGTINVVGGALQGSIVDTSFAGSLMPGVLVGTLQDESDEGGLASGTLAGALSDTQNVGKLSP